MKKVNLRPFLLVSVLVLSVLSFIYINTVVVGNTDVNGAYQQEFAKEKLDAVDTAEQEESTTLPDVMLVKKILERGKGIFPAS